MAMARASEASICGLLVSFSICMTIICTCSLFAPPVPVTALDLGCGVFGNFQAFFGASDNGRAASLSEFQRRVGVTCHEHLLDAHGHRAVGLDDLTNAAINDLQRSCNSPAPCECSPTPRKRSLGRYRAPRHNR
jgi:hypothetical protein